LSHDLSLFQKPVSAGEAEFQGCDYDFCNNDEKRDFRDASLLLQQRRKAGF
jgi:YHS domain-containing protein